MSKIKQIQAAKKINVKRIVCNEWRDAEANGDAEDFVLFVRSLPYDKQADLERRINDGEYGKDDSRLVLAALTPHCVYDDEQLSVATFAGIEPQEIMELNPLPRDRMFIAISDVNGLNQTRLEELQGK